MEDTTVIISNEIANKFDRLFDLALNTKPSNDNGYGLVLGVLLVLVALAILDRFFTNRKADRYRDRQEEKADLRWEAEQNRISAEKEAASKRAIEEQASREAARERVIEEQRKNAEELRKHFGKSLAPLESRIEHLEQEQREHHETIVLLRFKNKIDTSLKEEK
jgi:DNA anti-recombination protein RmuC